MPLTPAQLQTLKADLAANTALVEYPAGQNVAINTLPNHPDAHQVIADWYNGTRSPDYWIWRTRVSKGEFVGTVGPGGTTFSWTGTGFITRSQGERDAWRELFNGQGFTDPSQDNVRQAIQDIFSGAVEPAPSNRTHLAAVARRLARRIEHLFATGTGSTASPGKCALLDQSVLIYALTGVEVTAARNLP